MEKQTEEKKNFPLIPLVCGALAALLLAVYCGGMIYYQNRFARGTVIDQVDVSGMTIAELEERIESYTLRVLERKSDGTTLEDEIPGTDIGLSYASTEPLQEILEGQNAWLWFLRQEQEYELEDMIVWDEEALEEAVQALHGFDSDFAVEPTDAYVSEYVSGSGYSIVEETQGNTLNLTRTLAAVRAAVAGLEEEVDLDAEGCYETPEICADDEELQSLLTKLKTYENITITYTFGDNVEVLDGETICSWLSVEDLEATLDTEQVEEFVATLRKKYDTIFRSRTFRTSYGTEITISSGDYGWWMNYVQEAEELAEMIENGESGERTPVYYQTAASYDTPDYGDTYIEVNLTAQHLFYYEDGVLVMESDFVSGNSAKGYDTPVGVYSITYKQRDATLVGETYSTPVSYWMPFNGNIGLHDATWRSTFGGDIYKTNGSHGCINLPYAKAQELYSYVEKGTPVICYYLPGTEPAATEVDTSGETEDNVQAEEETESAETTEAVETTETEVTEEITDTGGTAE
ncbi:MAG: L,D-transpeptidase/peptidoglycan binding protein [Lachnospiraceae bacterium]|nr:L,D-transpeptidase/peptidoglycan binding protein [Lachnospiraceae bacterium]